MIVLLDADVLIDVALDRAPHAEAAGQLLDQLERRPGSAYVAWHTIANVYYLVAPARGGGEARDFVVDLIRFVAVAPTTTDSLRRAARLKMKDFEDAMQVAAAEACGAEVIATRNVRDYTKAPIRAAAPKALLAEMA
ncbi:MAG: PIN domain-containing protein [Gemmatimonadetes bacterium]|nr:PIN domain-containing protein [Gemmatimonadota bacterium]